MEKNGEGECEMEFKKLLYVATETIEIIFLKLQQQSKLYISFLVYKIDKWKRPMIFLITFTDQGKKEDSAKGTQKAFCFIFYIGVCSKLEIGLKYVKSRDRVIFFITLFIEWPDRDKWWLSKVGWPFKTWCRWHLFEFSSNLGWTANIDSFGEWYKMLRYIENRLLEYFYIWVKRISQVFQHSIFPLLLLE